jgi:hypothetical protein
MSDFAEGSIWEIFFYTKERINYSQKFVEQYMDNQTREMTATFDPPPGLNPTEYSSLFLQHFMKSREKSKEELEKISEKKHRYKVLVQVGNKECVEDLEKTMNSQDFHSWENPSVVDSFFQISRKYLNE